ncbi:Uncharacterized protein FWK35_00038584 [Aphis craccivora]|uniref:Uncharacterized protein n=1 Tax=Aphis craccivora TaxID=307492 RepID=A0A6G0VSM3_APHCR|nr:Uncharacterized protein FWK35_00038584 [Aphis craccivora]
MRRRLKVSPDAPPLEPIIGIHKNGVLIMRKKKLRKTLFRHGWGWRNVSPAPPTGIFYSRPEFSRRNSGTYHRNS